MTPEPATADDRPPTEASPASDEDIPICMMSYNSVTMESDAERTAGYMAATSPSRPPLSNFIRREMRPPSPMDISTQKSENSEKFALLSAPLPVPSPPPPPPPFLFCNARSLRSAPPNSAGTGLSLTTSRKFFRVTGSFLLARTRWRFQTRDAASETDDDHADAAEARFSRSLRWYSRSYVASYCFLRCRGLLPPSDADFFDSPS